MKINHRKFKAFIAKHKFSISIILIAVLTTLAILFYNFKNGENPFEGVNLNIIPKQKKEKVHAPLTGLETTEELAKRRPLAVVIENHPDARPQSGYNKADIVYETLAEGGITRTLAIFQSQNADQIGPVRSARPYFIDWLSEIKGIFVHVGGSIDAFDAIKAYKVTDINQFYFGSYFWRSKDRFAPHNVYTTTEKLYAAAKSAKYETSIDSLKWFSFKKDLELEARPQSQKISIAFSRPSFTVSYNYDPKTNDYIRSVGGVLAKDKVTGESIRTKNIIVQFETVSYGKTRAGEQKVNIGTISKGKGFLFQDGKAIRIIWEKRSRSNLTKITDENGVEIKLNPGRTWIEVPPVGANVTY